MPPRRAASLACCVWSPRGQDIWLCSLATSGTRGGTARAAAHQAPTMWACTRRARAILGRSQPANPGAGVHCRLSEGRTALTRHASAARPKRAASSSPAGVASPASRVVATPCRRSATDNHNADSCAPPGSSVPRIRMTLTRPPFRHIPAALPAPASRRHTEDRGCCPQPAAPAQPGYADLVTITLQNGHPAGLHALAGGWVATWLFHLHHPVQRFFNASTWLTAIAGAAVLLLAYHLVTGQTGRRTRTALR